MSIGLRVTDPAGNPIPNALVRAFRDGGQGAVEVGDAITDGTGVYQMFIAPP
jgi:protocatechuate 3,4-dioxygenase beta subunit